MNQKTTDELMKILSGITNKTDLGNYTDTLSKDDVPDFARTDRALAAAGYGRLYSKSRRDSIIIFALNKQLTVMELNELLCDMGENILD